MVITIHYIVKVFSISARRELVSPKDKDSPELGRQ